MRSEGLLPLCYGSQIHHRVASAHLFFLKERRDKSTQKGGNMNPALLILGFAAVAAISCAAGFFLGVRGAARHYAGQLASLNREFSERLYTG